MLTKQYDYTETTFDKLEVGDQFYTRNGVATGYARLYTKIEPVTIGSADVHSFMNATTGNGDNYFRCLVTGAVIKVTEKKLPIFDDLKIGEFFKLSGQSTRAFIKVSPSMAAVYHWLQDGRGWDYVDVEWMSYVTEVERLEKLPDR